MTKAQWAEHSAYQENENRRLDLRNKELSDEIQQVEKALDSMCGQNKELKRVIVQKCLDELKENK